jgi:hypothetical protein
MKWLIKKRVIIVFLNTLLALPLAFAQSDETLQPPATCPGGIPETANEADFVLRPNGEVLHIASNLIFMRCSVGQTWNGNTCTDEPRPLTWQEALQESQTNTTNNLMSWRLPNVKELSVISERACVRPSINDTVFPNTSPDYYWTSSPSILDEQAAWSIAFTNASVSQRVKTRSLFVRLVRDNIAE